MKNLQIILLASLFVLGACGGSRENSKPLEGAAKGHNNEGIANSDIPRSEKNSGESNAENIAEARSQPKDVRGFFMKLPNEYFVIESCEEHKKTSRCEKDKVKYLGDFTTIEDIKNGYLETGGDGAQGAMKMAIFKRPDGSYLVGLNVFSEDQDSYRFLNLVDGKWEDISLEIIPEYSTTNIYELPRQGTMVQVFAKKIIEQGKDFEVSEKGEKLYNLKWTEGKFSIQR